jgi:CelD/BcsL family acetyltransferase involved in cellulose biosynthesis
MTVEATAGHFHATSANDAPVFRTLSLAADEVSGLAAIDTLTDDWDGLPSPEGLAPLFLSPSWFSAFAAAFGGQAQLSVLAFRASGRLAGVFPMMRTFSWRGPGLSVQNDPLPGDRAFLSAAPRARVLPMRLLTPLLALESAGLRGGFRCAPADGLACKTALLGNWKQRRGWDMAVIPFAASEFEEWQAALASAGISGFFRETGGRRFHRRMHMQPAEEFLAGKSRNFRKACRAASRNAEELGLEQRIFSGPLEMKAGLDALEQAARSSWKHTGRADAKLLVPYTQKTRAFHEAIIEHGRKDVTPVIFAYFQGDVCKAAALVFCHRGVLSGSHTYHSPDIAKADPGKFVMMSCIEWASANNLSWIDFNATADYIANYTDARESWFELVVCAPHARGRIYGALAKRFSAALTELPSDQLAAEETN